MTHLKLIAVFIFLTACSSGPNEKNFWRKPTSEEKVTMLTVPVADINSVLSLEGDTRCSKQTHAARGNVKYHSYDCIHVTPFSFSVTSPSLGINKIFNGVHERTYQTMLSKSDLSVNPGLAAFHAEQMTETKQYLSDLANGCFGENVILTVREIKNKENVTLEHYSYFGKARCSLLKTSQKTKRAVVESYSNVKEGSKAIAKSTAEHAKWLLESADSLQESAREQAANGLKNLGEAISPN